MAQALEMGFLEELGKKLDQLERPDWVRSIDTVEQLDADDELAVWIWIVVDTAMPPQEQAQLELAALRKRIRELLIEQAPGLWAYVRIKEDGDGA
jgi:hypothetical protein